MSLLEQFRTMTEETIQSFIAEGRAEDLQLEFKTVRDASLSASDDRKNLAIALSGFANSAGGLIVWGVTCRGNADGIDCACAIAEISPVNQFLSRLEELTGQSSSPIVDGVQHRAFRGSSSTSGYVVTLVPESESGPFMAKLGVQKYYKRSGGATYQMEHFDLADMFGKRRRPELKLTAQLDDSEVTNRRALIKIGIENIGRSTAFAPHLRLVDIAPFKFFDGGLDGNGNHGMTCVRGLIQGQIVFSEGANFAIHPGMHMPVTRLVTSVESLQGAKTADFGFLICAAECNVREGIVTVPMSNTTSIIKA